MGLMSFAAVAQVTEGNSAVEQYRVQSHYGPEEALLSSLYPHEQKLEIGGGAAIAPLSSLMKYYGFQGSLIYHINRRHAVEPVFYSSNIGEFSSFDETQLIAKKDKIIGQVGEPAYNKLAIDIPKQMLAASYLFTPYHAKLHLSERSVSHFDLYFGLGAGAVQTEENFLKGGLGEKQWNAGALVTAGARLLIRPRFSFRMEARDFIHGANSFGTKGTTHSFQMGVALSMFFGSFYSL